MQEGICLIIVGGQFDVQFSLQGCVVVGVYDYFLFKGGVLILDDGNWYLCLEYVLFVDLLELLELLIDLLQLLQLLELLVDLLLLLELLVDLLLLLELLIDLLCLQVECLELVVYLVNCSVVLGMFWYSLYDCVGDFVVEVGVSSDVVVWMYFCSVQFDSYDCSCQVQVDGQISSVLVGVGCCFEVGGVGELQVGVMFGYGCVCNDSCLQVIGYMVCGVVIGINVGVYVIWLQDVCMQGGVYVDGWLQYGCFCNSVQGDGLQKECYDVCNWSVLVEVGYVLFLWCIVQCGIYL